MELPCRARGDELLRPGELTDIRVRLRKLAPKHDLATVIACAFDHRTRMLPFILADTRMAPAGVRAVGSAMVDAGFERTRIVLQQWNRNFRPSRMHLAGKIPDIFMVSSMGLHSQRCMELIRDARRIDPAHRPLIIAGGAKTMYQPWEVFSANPTDPTSADVAVTGEEYVLLNLLEVLLSARGGGESMRTAFGRARDSGALDSVPGLVYARGDSDGVAEELVDTGIQRLVADLDELPHPVLGYRLLEPPSRGATLGPRAVPPDRVRKYTPVASIVLTFGCKFACPYCPIPAYNQRQFRTKSGARIADEMHRLYKDYGIRYFFGADDNFFNDKARALDIVETLARAEFDGFKLRRRARWYTEATVHDALQMTEHLPLVHEAGCRGLWLGVEDMTGTLVKKGQSVGKTLEVFRRLREA
ncbi:MAG: B12-binding domain-containing radical SAM protein, partial [Planctomycetota bacterium]